MFGKEMSTQQIEKKTESFYEEFPTLKEMTEFIKNPPTSVVKIHKVCWNRLQVYATFDIEKMKEEMREICPKCRQKTFEEYSESTEMGDFDGKVCVNPNCKHSTVESSSPPAWFIEESRPTSGPGSRAPYGMGIRDKFGGL